MEETKKYYAMALIMSLYCVGGGLFIENPVVGKLRSVFESEV